MQVFLILFFLAMVANAQQEQQLLTRQRRSHLSLRQEQQQSDASPFLTEMMEIEAEMRRFWHRTLHMSASYSYGDDDGVSKAGKAGMKSSKAGKAGMKSAKKTSKKSPKGALKVGEGEEYVYGKSGGGGKAGGGKAGGGKAGGGKEPETPMSEYYSSSVKGTVKPTGYDSVKGTAAPAPAPIGPKETPGGKAMMRVR